MRFSSRLWTSFELRWVRRILCLLFTIVPVVDAIAQSESIGKPKVIPPSPTAAALVKYTDIPISYATGVPQVEIPIFEVKGKEISLPISLSYHGGGIKVDEKPGWLGRSWSLTGANGIISRTIRGLPDQGSKGYIANFDSLNYGIIDEAKQDLILSGELDADPDEYSYNFHGRSGKMLFMGDSIFTIPYENLDIGISETDATIVAENGVHYGFSGIEKYMDGNEEYTQTWYLTSISNVNGTEVIYFDYSEPFFVTDPFDPVIETSYFSGFTSFGHKDPVFVDRGQIRREVRLEKIVFEVTELRFYGITRLDSIVVFERGNRVKRHLLSYNSDGFLTTIIEQAISSDGSIYENELKHSMDYYPFLIGNKYAKDHWGFPNGALHNLDLLPIRFDLTPPANREPSSAENVQTAGALKSIRYPTGGIVELEYEANTYAKGDGPEDYISLGETTVTTSASWDVNMPPVPVVANSVISVSRDTKFRIDIRGSVTGTEGDGYLVDVGQSARVEIFKDQSTVPEIDLVVSIFSRTILELPRSYATDPGEYNVRLTILPPELSEPTITAINIAVDLIYNKVEENDGIVQSTGGGIRIKRITTKDGLGHSPDVIRRFEYNKQELNSHGDTIVVSSGRVTIIPSYTFSYDEYIYDETNSGLPNHVRQQAVTNGEQAIAGMGSPVYYHEVTEYLGENGEFGMTKYFFMPPTTAGGGFPYFPLQHDFQAGLPIGTNQYVKVNEGYQIVSKSETLYTFFTGENDPHHRRVRGVKVIISATYAGVLGADPVESTAQYYFVSTSWFHPTKKILTQYVGGVPSTQVVSEQFYDNLKHVQLTKTRENSSDGSFKIREMKYAEDFSGSNSVVSAMIGSGMTGVVVSTTLKREEGDTLKIVGSQLNKFGLVSIPVSPTGQGIVLKEVYQLESEVGVPVQYFTVSESDPFFVNEHMKRALKFDYYDEAGNLTQFTQEDRGSNSYLWDCEKRRPIAEIANATLSRVAYTSFECADYGGWSRSGGTIVSGTGDSVTGIKSCTGGVFTKSGLDPGAYKVSVWAKGSGSITVNSVSKAISSTWKVYEWFVDVSTSITVTTNGNQVDELRLAPTSAKMNTFQYDTGGRMVGSMGPTHLLVTYEYDPFKRLKVNKNHKGEILNAYEYHYQN